jgi:hypothetical protein
MCLELNLTAGIRNRYAHGGAGKMKDFIETSVGSSSAADKIDRFNYTETKEANVEKITVLDVMNATSSNDAVAKLVKIWENKNAQRAVRGAALSTMALSLAACGGSSSTDSTTDTTDTTDTTTTVVTPVVTPISAALTIGNDAVTGTTADDSVTGARIDTVQTLNSGDSIALGEGTDSLSATLNAGTITPASITGVETITFTAIGAATVDFDNVSGVTALVSTGSSAMLVVDDI